MRNPYAAGTVDAVGTNPTEHPHPVLSGRTGKRSVRRRRHRAAGWAAVALMSLVLIFFNARAIGNKADVFKSFMTEVGADYGGISESRTYNDEASLSDDKFRWDAGTEGRPKSGSGPSRGMGAFINRKEINATVVETGVYTHWHRIETLPGKGEVDNTPLFIGVGYFPDSKDVKGHTKANKELAACLRKYSPLGHVVFGGDLNAHTSMNGDKSPSDEAGAMLMRTVIDTDMLVVNAMDGLCTGGPTRRQVQQDGVQESTLDYVLCSPSLSSNITTLEIRDNQMGSDHRPMVLNLRGLKTFKPGKVPAREVWDISNIPLPEDDWSWVLACRDQFTKWIEEAGGIIKTLDAANAESQRLADILDWSFQCALDEVAYTHLGTKFVRNRPTPGLDATTKLLIQQEQVAKEAMRMVYDQLGSTEGEKKRARKQLLAASRAVMSAAMRKREVAELTLFRDVEANQGDSKLFWGRFKRLRGTTRINKSPPPSQPTTREKPSQTRWRSFVFGDGSVLPSPPPTWKELKRRVSTTTSTKQRLRTDSLSSAKPVCTIPSWTAPSAA